MSIGAVIMAAGAGRRMGNVAKALLRRDGEPLLLRQIRLASEAGVDAIAVVLGHHAAQVAAVLESARADAVPAPGMDRVRWVTNPAPDRGTGSSLRCALAALPADLAACLVLLGDQPLLDVGDVRAILAAWNDRAAGIELVVPQHAGRPGHPIAFGRVVRDGVMHAQGGAGVREWRRAHPEAVARLPLAHARCTTDVDTPEDLEHLRAECGVDLAGP